MLLPEKFLEWAYFDRVEFVKKLAEGKPAGSRLREPSLLLEGTRHTPVFCTASMDEKGHITVNGKVVGAGFVLKRKYLEEAVEKFRTHVESYATMSREEYRRKGVNLLLQLLYLEDRKEARRRVDFSKISTLEMAKGKPGAAEHTWTNLQRYRGEACFIYYMPPRVSFEVRGDVEVYREGPYHEFVNLVHDCYHRPLASRTDRPWRTSYADIPCVILNVKEVYDNSATPRGFGIKMT
jgi:hypothetical protein